MRVIFDANLYLNVLLSREPDRSLIGHLLKPAAGQVFDLLLPEDVVGELSDVVKPRSYLATRLNQEALDALFHQLLEFATPLPLLEQEPPRIARDTNDDYLIALAVLNEVDCIVTRDRDLLDLEVVACVRIVDPIAFLRLLRGGLE